ncbi:hypothetical protein, partial [Streptococcus suis]|uniref:hypothetical protein n=1 Tax=Streptococcus suis TaxID=1307 RepID=UPI001EE6FE61
MRSKSQQFVFYTQNLTYMADANGFASFPNLEVRGTLFGLCEFFPTPFSLLLEINSMNEVYVTGTIDRIIFE